jgi:sodium-dependent phosphate cotransporter
LTDALYGTDWLPNPAHFNFIRAATRPVEHAVIHATAHVSSTLGPLFTIVIGAGLILVAVRYLGKLLKLLMVGRARDVLVKAVGGTPISPWRQAWESPSSPSPRPSPRPCWSPSPEQAS